MPASSGLELRKQLLAARAVDMMDVGLPWSFIHAVMTPPEVSDYLGQMTDGGAYPADRPKIIGAMKVAVPNGTEDTRSLPSHLRSAL